MDKKTRINRAYQYLKYHGLVHKQEDVAKKMGATRANVSSALSGDPRVLTESFIARFVKAYDYIFSLEWLTTGEGTMLASGTLLPSEESDRPAASSVASEPTLMQYSAIPTWAESLISIISKQIAENEVLNRELRQSVAEVKELKEQLLQLLKTII